jgi:beta-glucosidase
LAEKPSTEIVGNIDDLTLPMAQIELVKSLSELNKPIILVCNFNRPRIVNEIEPLASAILYAYLPGDEGGRAIVDIMTGKINPSGKLPFTYPRFVNNFTHYDHKLSEEVDVDFSMNAYKPQYDFGFGLSYSQFEYSNLKVKQATQNQQNVYLVEVDIINKSNREGKEAVQLYYNDLVASITPAVKKLCGFQKVNLLPNEKKTVKFVLKKEDFSFINKDLKRVSEPGEIELIIQNLKHTINVQ